jgi:hypothetical protein
MEGNSGAKKSAFFFKMSHYPRNFPSPAIEIGLIFIRSIRIPFAPFRAALSVVCFRKSRRGHVPHDRMVGTIQRRCPRNKS